MGELRIRKRGDKWQYSFEGAPVDGKRTTISKSGYKTKTEADTEGTAALQSYWRMVPIHPMCNTALGTKTLP